MSTAENRELVRRIIEEWNSLDGDAGRMRDLFGKYYSPGFVYHDICTGDTDLEQTVHDMTSYLSAFPDLNYSVDDILADGDKAVVRCTLRATHEGMFRGIPATGRQIVVGQVEIHRIADQKIAEAWGFSDVQGMMKQLKTTGR